MWNPIQKCVRDERCRIITKTPQQKSYVLSQFVPQDLSYWYSGGSEIMNSNCDLLLRIGKMSCSAAQITMLTDLRDILVQ